MRYGYISNQNFILKGSFFNFFRQFFGSGIRIRIPNWCVGVSLMFEKIGEKIFKISKPSIHQGYRNYIKISVNFDSELSSRAEKSIIRFFPQTLYDDVIGIKTHHKRD